jgi:hypothetical protein
MRYLAIALFVWTLLCFFAWCLAAATKRREECTPEVPKDAPHDYPDDDAHEDFTLFHMIDHEQVWGEVIERNGVPMSVRYCSDEGRRDL